MDYQDALNREFFRPFATLVAPGATLIAPFCLVALHYYPDLSDLWKASSGSALLALTVLTVAAGLVLEDIGARIEMLWDRKIEYKDGTHKSTWESYLRLVYDPGHEPIGQHYLRSIVLRLKFELGFSVALFLSWFGWLWLHIATETFTSCFFVLASLLWMTSTVYLCWESYTSSWHLHRLRHLLLKDESSPASGQESEL